MLNLIEVLKMKVTNLREGNSPTEETVIEVLSYTKVELLESMVDYMAEHILDILRDTLKVSNKHSMGERFDETAEYLEKSISEISGKKARTYILCLLKSLRLNADNIDEITEKVGTKLNLMSENEIVKFKKVLRNELLIPLKDKVTMNFLSEICKDNTYSDICMLLLEYLANPVEEMPDDAEDDEEDEEILDDVDDFDGQNLKQTKITVDDTNTENNERSTAATIDEVVEKFTLDELQEMVKRKMSSDNA